MQGLVERSPGVGDPLAAQLSRTLVQAPVDVLRVKEHQLPSHARYHAVGV